MYLRDLLTTHNPSRNLRSSSHHLLSVGYMRTVSSLRCFKHSAAINWNDLPFDIRACDSVNVFKLKLKTHLFNIAYATLSRFIPAPTNNILVTYGALQVLYCIVSYCIVFIIKIVEIKLAMIHRRSFIICVNVFYRES